MGAPAYLHTLLDGPKVLLAIACCCTCDVQLSVMHINLLNTQHWLQKIPLNLKRVPLCDDHLKSLCGWDGEGGRTSCCSLGPSLINVQILERGVPSFRLNEIKELVSLKDTSMMQQSAKSEDSVCPVCHVSKHYITQVSEVTWHLQHN